ncbi:hypothetical protein BDN72DRAFT_830062, partial [Pluteus cervinus]
MDFSIIKYYALTTVPLILYILLYAANQWTRFDDNTVMVLHSSGIRNQRSIRRPCGGLFKNLGYQYRAALRLFYGCGERFGSGLA